MLKFQSLAEAASFSKSVHSGNASLGLIPTMGALHQGHLSLVESAKQKGDKTVVTIFVNPLQFNDEEDFKNYPITLEEDLKQLEQIGCDAVFIPRKEELYSASPKVGFSFGAIEKKLEGAFRPGHFRGVGIIVSKLFNIIMPSRAYFGLKDLQQYLIIKQLVNDLSYQIEIVGVNTARELSGLAMSSRNMRLSKEGKIIAANLYQGLKNAEKLFLDKIPCHHIKEETSRFYSQIEGLEIEYLELVNTENMDELELDKEYSEVAVCVAGYVEGIRLIDNLYLRLK